MSLGFSLGKSEDNVVGVILGKGLGFTVIANDVLPLDWLLGLLLGIWGGFLLVITTGDKLGTPLGCWVGKYLGVPVGLKLYNTVGVVLGICDGFLLVFSLGFKKWEPRRFVGWWFFLSLLSVVMDVLTSISVVKPDSDKLGCWLVRILETLLNT